MARLLRSLFMTSVYALGIHLASTTFASAEDLEKAFLKQAPQVLKALQDKGYKNVGVLKFRVKKGIEPVSDNVGTLNLTLANRLEVALALVNPIDASKQVGIIHDASSVAARIKDANHLLKPGRSPLFQETYPLAWGDQQVKPDAFLMGAAKVSPDLKEMTVNVMAFDKDSEPSQVVQAFTVSTDANMLSEMGESFLLRGVFGGGDIGQGSEKAVASAAKVYKKEEDYPIQDKSAPVTLEVRYDGQLVPFDLKNGRAYVRDPQEGQKVEFGLRRKGNGTERYGVVLKVNGENVLFHEKQADAQCRKIVLEPGSKPITIKGFQTTDKTVREFKVLSRFASKQNEMYYGPDVGTVCMVVFPEKSPKAAPPVYTDVGEDLAAITRGTFPAKRATNLDALKAQLRHEATRDENRGIISEGGNITAGTTKETGFIGAPTPIMTATIVYYKP